MNARLSLSLALVLLTCTPVAYADFSTGFETSSGAYTSGSTIIGVDDTGAPGTNTWTALFGSATTGSLVITNTNVQSGSQALQINDTTGSANAAFLNLTNTAVNYSSPFKIHFAMNILSLSTPTSNNQIQFYFGAATTDPGGGAGGRYWAEMLYNNGNLEFYKYNGTTTNTVQVRTSLALYAPTATLTTSGTFSNVVTSTNGYVGFDITIDPVSKTYAGLQITNTAGVVTDLTSSVSGVTIPWSPGTTPVNGDPAYNLLFVTGSDDITTVNFDNVSVSNVPEPVAWALVVFSAVATIGYRCRRRY